MCETPLSAPYVNSPTEHQNIRLGLKNFERIKHTSLRMQSLNYKGKKFYKF